MMLFESLDDKFNFGKYEGKTLIEVIRKNPFYFFWVLRTIKGDFCAFEDSVIEEMKTKLPDFDLTNDLELCRRHQLDVFNRTYNEPEEYFDDGDIPTYDRYSGSYAQDVMGYSDDDIDIIFDGDPEAYWNID